MGVGQHRAGHRVPGRQPSAWTAAEQDELVGFLRDLTQRTRCKVLLTSRRDEQAWLGDLPARLRLPPMPMRERLELAAAHRRPARPPWPGGGLAAAAAIQPRATR